MAIINRAHHKLSVVAVTVCKAETRLPGPPPRTQPSPYTPSALARLLPDRAEGVEFAGDGVVAGVEGGAEEAAAQVTSAARQVLGTKKEKDEVNENNVGG